MIRMEWNAGTLQYTLEGIERGLSDMRPAWESIGDIFRAFMRQVFRSQGSYGGSAWQPLNPAYAMYKRRRYGSKPILQATGALMASFTNKASPEHVARIGPSFAEFGSRTRYAKAHQFGFPPRNLVARPMIRAFTKAEGERVVDAILAHLFKSARGRR